MKVDCNWDGDYKKQWITGSLIGQAAQSTAKAVVGTKTSTQGYSRTELENHWRSPLLEQMPADTAALRTWSGVARPYLHTRPRSGSPRSPHAGTGTGR